MTSQYEVSPAAAPAPLSQTRPLYWSIKREIWENRSVYIAPVSVAAFVLFASLISMIFSQRNGTNIAAIVKPFSMSPAPVMLSTFIVGFFYCLDALYSERRDRSILFWKSLPISDRMTVLAKVCIPLVVLPLIAYALSVFMQIAMLTIGTLIVAGGGTNPVRLWSEVEFFEGLVIMFYGLAVHALWFSAIYGWLMLVSAWARRAVFLWALLPPLGIAAFERIAFDTKYFANMLGYRVMGAMREAFVVKKGSHGDVDSLSQLTPGRFLLAPGLWAGLIFAALCIAAAMRMRRNREPI